MIAVRGAFKRIFWDPPGLDKSPLISFDSSSKLQNETKTDHEREWDFCGGGDGQSQPDAGHAARGEFHIVLLSLSFQLTKNGV